MQSLCVIAGAPRSGSTTLFFQLQSHPQISGATRDGVLCKETDYLLGLPGGCSSSDYLSHFEHINSARVLLEASPSYMGYPLYGSGVSSFLQGLPMPVKIIAILRDPVDRIASHYRTKALIHEVLKNNPEFLHELIISDYWLQLSQYRVFRDSGCLHLIPFPDLIRDQKSVLSGVCNFSGPRFRCYQ